LIFAAKRLACSRRASESSAIRAPVQATAFQAVVFDLAKRNCSRS
jgi:hypothetical protein